MGVVGEPFYVGLEEIQDLLGYTAHLNALTRSGLRTFRPRRTSQLRRWCEFLVATRRRPHSPRSRWEAYLP